jgi:hypothetical protein
MRSPDQTVELSAAAIAEIAKTTVPTYKGRRFSTSMGTMKRRSQAVAIKETLELAITKELHCWKDANADWRVNFKRGDDLVSKLIGSDYELVKFVKAFVKE